MQLTNNTFFNPKNHLYSKPIKGLRGYGLSYRFTFNGKELDNETYGEGNAYDYGARIYSSRLGRFLTVDPLSQLYTWQTPYAYIRNNPIVFVDINGEGDPLAKMQIRENRASNMQGMVRTPMKGPNAGIPNAKPHQGFDLYAKQGTPIMAVKDAEVLKVVHDEKGDYGNQITLKITNDKGEVRYAQYSHLKHINISATDKNGNPTKVNEGDVIGTTGTSGNADPNSPHLHFEYRDQPSPGKGLGGRLDPNEVLDTKFYSQDPRADQKKQGVVKVDKNGNATKMDIGGKTAQLKDYTPTVKVKK
jgi:RHS repeat-associated protein